MLDFMQGGDTAGKKEAGLPNIQQTLNVKNIYYGVDSTFVDQILVSDGVFRTVGHSTNTGGNGYGVPETAQNGFLQYLNFSMQRGNAIYGKANTVQPAAIVLIPQIRF